MANAPLSVEPGKPPSLMTPPSLHSVAIWACAEPVASPNRQTAAKMASPNEFQCDMSFPQTCNCAEVRTLNQPCATANAQFAAALRLRDLIAAL
jgi:hypothetical protein